MLPAVAGWRCRVCATLLDIATAGPAVCPRRTSADQRHVLDLVTHRMPARTDDINPFLAYRERLAFDAFAAAHGMLPVARQALIAETDQLVAAVAGTGFRVTPLTRNEALSDALGFSSAGGVWVKDETGNVAGSHKARHLMSTLLVLRASEVLGVPLAAGVADGVRPPLAISSCGNAAIAASTLAAAVSWPIRVFVPAHASAPVLARLSALGAEVITCPRRVDDPPGDPCLHRFREAVASGAIPFGVVGPDNAWCLDGGRTIGWELADQFAAAELVPDAVFVQVGGGALGTCLGAGLRESALGGAGHPTPLIGVQTEGCAPLARARRRLDDLAVAPDEYACWWSDLMWPWETVPTSLADGILDDETYDWIGLLGDIVTSGGDVVAAPEAAVIEASRLVALSGVDASPTGSAGLAGLIASRRHYSADARLVVVLSGVRHHGT